MSAHDSLLVTTSTFAVTIFTNTSDPFLHVPEQEDGGGKSSGEHGVHGSGAKL